MLSTGNVIFNNIIANTAYCIQFYNSSNNEIFHNSFMKKSSQVYTSYSVDLWDDGYPSGGNYWSDYIGADLFRGSNQDKHGSDGIGDTPYVIDNDNIDHYPLINPWTPTETTITVKGEDYPVTIVSNTTLEQIIATSNTLHFKSSGPTGDTGYVNVIFPMVNTTDIKVFIDGQKLTPPPFPVINSNGTHYFIYFEFTLSAHDIAIQFAPLSSPTPPVGGEWIPIDRLQLLAPWISLVSLMTAVTASFVYVRRKKKQD
jgi:parallel beta-helix repeat protein